MKIPVGLKFTENFFWIILEKLAQANVDFAKKSFKMKSIDLEEKLVYSTSVNNK